MSPEQQRIKIAEACGWKDCQLSAINPSFLVGLQPDFPSKFKTRAPDYLSDLNAMHEAEKARWTGDLQKLHNDAATFHQWKQYQSLLEYNVHATAAQRAEAFLRTLNLWDDTK